MNQCLECFQTFKHRYSLVLHLRTMHGDPQFHCSKCARSFRKKHNLNEHVKRIHEKSGDYECPQCSTTFVSPYERDRHLRMHTRKDGFECTICHVKLAGEGQRKQHMRLHPDAGTSKIKRRSSGDGDTAAQLPPKQAKPVLAPLIDIEGGPITKPTKLVKPGKEEPTASNNQASIQKAANGTCSSNFLLRLRADVKFKTSSGRMLTATDQPASMTFGAFRKLFDIPSSTTKRFIFKQASPDCDDDEWIVVVDDDAKLPLVDGHILAETCVDF